MDDVYGIEGVEDLYAGPPERFVASRNGLAARLRSTGEDAAAAAVRRLRRPSVAAWAIDALARTHGDDLDALIRAGEALAAAQRSMAVGSGADRLREITGERRRLIDRLVRAATRSLEGAGLSSSRATTDKVADTLMAISYDAEAASLVRRGVLDKELPPPAGFGDAMLDPVLLASVTTLPSRAVPADPEASRGPAQIRREEERRRRAEELSAAAKELEVEADRLDSVARAAASTAAEARKVAEAARRRALAARRKAQKAAGP
jgi:hypothetical protein